MIVYDKLFDLMRDRGLTTYKIRKDKIISEGALTALRHNGNVTTDTINRLCAALHCQPGDILDYIEDPTDAET